MSEVPGEQPGQQRHRCRQSVVMEFGGTSLADAAAIRRAIRIVKQRLARDPVVVASALADVTDQLLAAGQAAAKGQSRRPASLQYLQRRHEQVALDARAGSESLRLFGHCLLESSNNSIGCCLRSPLSAN